MSGGSHDYAYSKIEAIADSFDPVEPERKEIRKKVGKILRLMAKICHDIEWIDSGDYGESDWLEVEKNLNKIKII